MNVRDLHEALGRQIENGHGDFEVVVRMGNGKSKSVTGYEVATSARYDAEKVGAEKQEFRIVTDVLF